MLKAMKQFVCGFLNARDIHIDTPPERSRSPETTPLDPWSPKEADGLNEEGEKVEVKVKFVEG